MYSKKGGKKARANPDRTQSCKSCMTLWRVLSPYNKVSSVLWPLRGPTHPQKHHEFECEKKKTLFLRHNDIVARNVIIKGNIVCAMVD